MTRQTLTENRSEKTVNLAEVQRRGNVKRLLLSLVVCLATAVSLAQPNYMNYQGKLVQDSGEPLPSGQYTMEVNLYDASQGGNLVWGPFYFDGATSAGHTSAVNIMDGGTFNVIMGDEDVNGKPLSEAFDHSFAAKRFVELTVNGGSPMLPRQQFLSAPYAFRAGRLANVVNTAAGNVGIGTETPATKLDVNGNVNFNGNLNVTGTAFVHGALFAEGTASLGGDLTVQKDIEFGGKIKNFAVSYTGNWAVNGTGSNNINQIDFPLALPGSDWFCSIGGVGGYISNKADNQSQFSCRVTISNGMWYVRVGADGNGTTDCFAHCFKYQ